MPGECIVFVIVFDLSNVLALQILFWLLIFRKIPSLSKYFKNHVNLNIAGLITAVSAKHS